MTPKKCLRIKKTGKKTRSFQMTSSLQPVHHKGWVNFMPMVAIVKESLQHSVAGNLRGWWILMLRNSPRIKFIAVQPWSKPHKKNLDDFLKKSRMPGLSTGLLSVHSFFGKKSHEKKKKGMQLVNTP